MDATDRQIIELLRKNGRLSYAELARQVGLSAPSVHERVGKLEAAGVIQGYRAEVAPETLGLGVTALIGIVQQTDSELDDVEAALREIPQVESCYFLAGEESYLLKVRVATMAELERLIGRINRIRGVARTRTTVALSTKWENRPQPMREP
ncbi:MAG TPA: Lrp/AsnC family transcriptional regulator [Natronosporangium sp.]|nr:Lrp/AsnC family transcriptional regulator [Natronosporangium sp.]